jgi:hypothetical protein
MSLAGPVAAIISDRIDGMFVRTTGKSEAGAWNPLALPILLHHGAMTR